MKLLPWLQLVRLPNLASSVSNVLAGAAFGLSMGGSLRWPSLLCACAASLCIYTAGMVLNDVADANVDAKTRPDRPIPSGAIPRKSAALFGVSLLAIAGGFAAFTHTRSSQLLVAIGVVSVLYNFLLKQSPAFGPLSLAFCRAANWLVGFLTTLNLQLLFDGLVDELPISLLLAYGLYILAVSSLARMEDDVVHPLRAQVELCLALIAVALIGISLASWQSALLLVPVFFVDLRLFFGNEAPTPKMIQNTVGTLLMGIYWIDASIAFLGFGWWALLLLLPFFAAAPLRKKISPS